MMTLNHRMCQYCEELGDLFNNCDNYLTCLVASWRLQIAFSIDVYLCNVVCDLIVDPHLQFSKTKFLPLALATSSL